MRVTSREMCEQADTWVAGAYLEAYHITEYWLTWLCLGVLRPFGSTIIYVSWQNLYYLIFNVVGFGMSDKTPAVLVCSIILCLSLQL